MEMFGSYSDMPAQLMQSLLVTSLQPDKNLERGEITSVMYVGYKSGFLEKGMYKP